MNTEKFPFDNPKFRKALSYAIDREAITKNVFNQSATPRMSALPNPIRLRNQPYFRDNNELLAKQLFEEALEEMGLTRESFPEIELSFISDVEFGGRITQAVQDQWRKVLGIKSIRLKNFEHNVYFNNITCGNFDMGFMSWVSLVSDLLFILNCFTEKSDLMNKANWENTTYKKLINNSNYALGAIERTKLLIEAETILMDEMPIIPICSLNKRFAKHPQLKGVMMTHVPSIDFKSAYFDSE